MEEKNGAHACTICSLKAYINKDHQEKELAIVKNQYTYINKWVSNDQIDQKHYNHFWKAPKILDAHKHSSFGMRDAWVITVKAIFGQPHIQRQIAHYAPTNTRDTCPTFESICSNPHIKGLYIARHNNNVHQITHTL